MRVAVYISPAYKLIKAIMRPLLMAVTKRDWRGAEFLPKSGGVVVAANHTSYFDPLAVGHFVVDNGRAPRFLGKVEVFKNPILGRLFKAAGQIPVHRGTAIAAVALRDAIAGLERGECIVVYPEGTTTLDPGLWPMKAKTGAARMALMANVPLIPVAQWGPEKVIPDKAFKIRLFPIKTMQVHAGPPVDLDDLRGKELTSELLEEATERIMKAITELLAEIRGEQPPAERFDPRKRRGGASS